MEKVDLWTKVKIIKAEEGEPTNEHYYVTGSNFVTRELLIVTQEEYNLFLETKDNNCLHPFWIDIDNIELIK